MGAHGPARPPLERARRHDRDLGPLPGAPRPPGLTRGRRIRLGCPGSLVARARSADRAGPVVATRGSRARVGLRRRSTDQRSQLRARRGRGEDCRRASGGDRPRRRRAHVLRRVGPCRQDGRRCRARPRCLPRRHTRANGARHRPGGRRQGERRSPRRDLRVEPAGGRRRRHRAEGIRPRQPAGAAALGRGGRGVHARDAAWLRAHRHHLGRRPGRDP